MRDISNARQLTSFTRFITPSHVEAREFEAEIRMISREECSMNTVSMTP